MAIFTGLISCNATKFKTKKYANHSISLEKTACFGTCPQYVLTINGKGEMEFKGKKFTKMDGLWKAQLTDNEISQFFGEIKTAKLFNLLDEYPTNYSDLPASIITYNDGKKTKTIRIEGTHPEALDVLIKKIESKMESAEWSNQNTF